MEALTRLSVEAFDVEHISGDPLRVAVENDQLEVLDLLLARGAAPTAEQLEVLLNNAASGRSALRLAAAGLDAGRRRYAARWR